MGAISKLAKTINGHGRRENDERFRLWQVESLLNQTADLLDRCLLDQQELRVLDAKRAELAFTVATAAAETKLATEREDHAWYRLDEAVHDATEELFVDVTKQDEDAAGALLSAMKQAHRGYTEQGYLGSNASQYETARAANLRGKMEVHERKIRFRAVVDDVQRQMEYLDAANKARKVREGESVAAGALDFEAQMATLSLRIEADFKDAYDRAAVAAMGLAKIYRYPKAKDFPEARDGGDLLAKAVLWTREAIRFMAEFAQYDQTFSLTLSLQRLSDQVWPELLLALKKDGVATTSFFISIENRMQRYRHVRLRGIAAFARGSDKLWSVGIALPKEAYSRQGPDTAGDKYVDLDQSAMPECRIGRVEGRHALRPPEIAGTNSLMNASPFAMRNDAGGKWCVRVESQFDEPMGKSEKLEDIEIELILAGQLAH